MFSFRRVYGRLLVLYPKSYRQRYGDQILQTVDDMLASEPRRARRATLAMRELFFLPGAIAEQHLFFEPQQSGVRLRLIGAVTAVLLLPAYSVFAIDEIGERFHYSHPLSVWPPLVLLACLIILPLVNLVFSAVSALVLLRANNKALKPSWELRHSWPLLLESLLSAGILCVVALHGGSLVCV